MKPKRVILCVEHPAEASILKQFLWARGYRALSCENQEECVTLLSGIDLVLIGYRIPFDEQLEASLGVPLLRLYPDTDRRQLLERIRIALVRKRGPKLKAVAGCPSAVVGEERRQA